MPSETIVTLQANAHSGGTHANGERQTAVSRVDTITLPLGTVFRQNSVQVNVISSRGETEDHIEWDDMEEIIPGTGIFLPRTVRVWTECRSPKVPPPSNINVSGDREIEVKVTAVKYR